MARPSGQGADGKILHTLSLRPPSGRPSLVKHTNRNSVFPCRLMHLASQGRYWSPYRKVGFENLHLADMRMGIKVTTVSWALGDMDDWGSKTVSSRIPEITHLAAVR